MIQFSRFAPQLSQPSIAKRYFITNLPKLNKPNRLDTPPTDLSSIHGAKNQLSQPNYNLTNTPQNKTDSQSRDLTPQQLAKIEQITSKLYQPTNPLNEPSKSALIEEKIKSIELKLAQQQQRDEIRLQKMLIDQQKILKPTLSDFKRPLTSMFLLASCVYLTLQFLWWHLITEEHIESMEIKTRAYERVIQDLLNEQKKIIESNGEFGEIQTKKKRWWLF
ncbi:unnamed protein product [Ambrosiozyma monospora]|uniref:Unnamed protein product n=1 Tax=Ambrosiozyma monospora TaxID=43982 RepID=A0ACB5T8U3_AMBMO|nr:unnamed protein product [Ambrosiozyma monospora]